ncbi:hypothetical protein NIES4074_16130 [Cylindrospermum sp. NIES-4074]|nr:hypothetical protein NIES4074_16130 [Cylindrospermum sp. NIES-4074]
MLTTTPISRTLKIAGLVASVSLASLVVTPKANAATVLFSSTSSDSFSNLVTELNGTPKLTVSKYNPLAGETITKVLVSLSASLTSGGTITNTAAQAQTFTVGTFVDKYKLVPVAGAPAVLSTLNPFPSSPLIGKQEYSELAPNTPSGFGPFTINGSNSIAFTNAADIGQFLGSGNFSVAPFTSIFTGIAGGGGNVSTNITTLASATFTVEYQGEKPVPEPLTILGTLTAAGLGVAMKKFKSRQVA